VSAALPIPLLPAAATTTAAAGAAASALPLAAPLSGAPAGGFEQALFDAARLLEAAQLVQGLEALAPTEAGASASAPNLAALLEALIAPENRVPDSTGTGDAAAALQTAGAADAEDIAHLLRTRSALTELVLGTTRGVLNGAPETLAGGPREASTPRDGLQRLELARQEALQPLERDTLAPLRTDAGSFGGGANSGGESGRSQSEASALLARSVAAVPEVQAAGAGPLETSPAREVASLPAQRALPELPMRNEVEIVRSVQALAERGGGRMSIELRPPELGGLQLQVALSHGAVRVSMLAEHSPVAELLARHAPELRTALESQGLRVDRLDVDAGADFSTSDSGSRHAGERDPQQPHTTGPGATASRDLFESVDPRAMRSLELDSLGTVDLRV
jgi:flagellar hook-length control protein FliK